MGTRLIGHGLDLTRDSSALWNLKRPELVAAIHHADVTAGADALLANTFQANPTALRPFGEVSRFEAINQRAVELAREAAGPDRFVLGSIAPEIAHRGTVEQAALLVELGVDAILLETWEPPFLARVAARLRPLVPIPLLGSVHRWTEASDHHCLPALLRELDAFGVNCLPPAEAADRLRAIQAHVEPGYPLLSQPCAAAPGLPAEPPETFEAAANEWLRLGVRLLGGCCGTDERHVQALRAAVDRS